MSERFATLDIGSNSVLLHVAERAPDGSFRVVGDFNALTRLSEGVGTTGRLRDEALERTAAVVIRFVAIALKLGAQQVAAVGTAGLRRAANASAFVDRVKAACDVTVDVISGEAEAHLSYLGVRSSLPRDVDEVFVVDVGGASTEFIFGSGEHLRERFSLDFGAVVLTEEFLVSDPVSPDELRALLHRLDAALASVGPLEPGVTLCGTGGTFTTLAAVHHALPKYDPHVVAGTLLARSEVERLVDLFLSRPVAERHAIVGLDPGRADIILAGSAIVLAVLRKLGADAVRVSDRGVRHGLLLDRFGGG